MSLSASMWTAVSGLLAHGDKMNVVGNNIANVSTIGFKSQRMDFNDYLYIERGSTSGPTQIGEGVSIYAVLGDFSQGSFESTNSGTDIAIDGNGWFGVRRPNSEALYYTRAGDFYFNQKRELVNPEQFVVQGYEVDNRKQTMFFTGASVRADNTGTSAFVGTGAPKDIVLDSWYCNAQRTTNVNVTNRLVNEDIQDKTTSNTNPLTALYDLWDAKNTQLVPPQAPLSSTAYATQSSVKIYDEGGTKHEATVYFDKVNTPVYDNNNPPQLVYELQGLPAGYSVYEYLVTIPPSEDMRSYGGTNWDTTTNTFLGTQPTNFYDPSGANTSMKAGVLMSGILVFDNAGEIVNQTAYTYAAQWDGDNPANVNNQVPATWNPDNKSYWQPTKFSSNGLPVFTANFTGQPLANSVSEMMQNAGGPPPYSQAQNYIIELDFGLTNGNGSWTNPTKSLANLATGSQTNVIYSGDSYTITSPNAPTTNITTAASSGTPSVTSNVTGTAPGSIIVTTTVDNGIAADPNGTVTTTITYAGPTTVDTATSTAPDSVAVTKPIVDYTNDVSRMTSAVRAKEATVNQTEFITDIQQDGYPSGTLQGYNIDTNGVLYARYSNNVTLPQYQITLYDFRNLQGLRRDGGNLYSETRDSGNARVGVAGYAGFGATESYNIEQSNVDMAREFVQMITTQRGFQANSKSITTVDTMLETVIGMKR